MEKGSGNSMSRAGRGLRWVMLLAVVFIATLELQVSVENAKTHQNEGMTKVAGGMRNRK